MEILATYERASGQQINRDKTMQFFSKSTSQGVQDAIKDAPGVLVVQQYEKYLGLPSFIGRRRRKALII